MADGNDAAAEGTSDSRNATPAEVGRFREAFQPAVLYSIYWLLFSARLYPDGYTVEQIADITAKADTCLRLVKMRLESEAFVAEFTKAVQLPPPTSSVPQDAGEDPAVTFPGLYL
jgi:hypothetical protein